MEFRPLGARIVATATGPAPSATALALLVAAGRPPMLVNSSVKVARLNVDYLDDLDRDELDRIREEAR